MSQKNRNENERNKQSEASTPRFSVSKDKNFDALAPLIKGWFLGKGFTDLLALWVAQSINQNPDLTDKERKALLRKIEIGDYFGERVWPESEFEIISKDPRGHEMHFWPNGYTKRKLIEDNKTKRVVYIKPNCKDILPSTSKRNHMEVVVEGIQSNEIRELLSYLSTLEEGKRY